ncbi:MAG TPA: hypothetical protein ENI73_01415 [Spirochaetes bacterium]|nr:hypothetical protein [Spirochaetota bacterium]
MFKDQPFRFNRIALLIFMFLFIGSGLVFLLLNYLQSSQYEDVHLFFTDTSYSTLLLEDQQTDKDLPVRGKMNLTLQYLINGPVHSGKLRSLINNKTRIKSLSFHNQSLDINLSKEFLQDLVPQVHDGQLIIHSILATFFISFPEVKTIRFYLEDRPLKTIFGRHSFDYPFHRDRFLKTYESLLQGA